MSKQAVIDWLKKNKMNCTTNYNNINVRNDAYGDSLSSVTISGFPGCCGIAVVNHLRPARSRNVSGVCMELAKYYAREQHYGMLLYAVTSSQREIISILKGLDFEQGKWYRNPKHNSKICLFYFNLSGIGK